jgi:hypothetical protein
MVLSSIPTFTGNDSNLNAVFVYILLVVHNTRSISPLAALAHLSIEITLVKQHGYSSNLRLQQSKVNLDICLFLPLQIDK